MGDHRRPLKTSAALVAALGLVLAICAWLVIALSHAETGVQPGDGPKGALAAVVILAISLLYAARLQRLGDRR